MGSTVDHGAAQDGGDVDVRSWKSRDTLKLKDRMDSTFEMCLSRPKRMVGILTSAKEGKSTF